MSGAEDKREKTREGSSDVSDAGSAAAVAVAVAVARPDGRGSSALPR